MSGAPTVLWVLGSDSDLPHVEAGMGVMESFGIPFEVRILSAHRTPDAVDQLASDARNRGVQVIIAVAGGAAHLPGVLAARTILPVIGVPVPTSMQGGLDSLLSMVQMPGGIPVATVGANKGGGKNAALLAAEILALADEDMAARLGDYRRDLATAVLDRDRSSAAREPRG